MGSKLSSLLTSKSVRRTIPNSPTSSNALKREKLNAPNKCVSVKNARKNAPLAKRKKEERRKAAMSNMNQNNAGYLGRDRQRGGGNKQTVREKKRKVLAERRKPLNIDHLAKDKLTDKAKELHKYFIQMENEKYDLEVVLERQKYDISQLRQRVNELNVKFG